jgi:SAM-dependent methyltransferase
MRWRLSTARPGDFPVHDTAFAIGRKFLELYGRPPGLVVEIGSQDVNGSLKDALPAGFAYVGLDLAPGKNVDLVARGRQTPLADACADLVLSSSAMEHDPLFWLTFLELCRITRPGGHIYLNAPSNGHIHRHPLDCWRFYPDAAQALVEWARIQGTDVTCVETFTAERVGDIWNDFVAVFARGAVEPRTDGELLSGHFACWNVGWRGAGETARPNELPEDVRLLAGAITSLLTLEARSVALAGPAADIRSLPHVEGMKRLVSGPAASGLRFVGAPAARCGDLGPFQVSFQAISRGLDMVKPAKSREVKRRTPKRTAAAGPARPVGVVAPADSRPRGNFDGVFAGVAAGWVWNAADPEARLEISVTIHGRTVSKAAADRYRNDLNAAGIGDGAHSFEIPLPPEAIANLESLTLRVEALNFDVPRAKKFAVR